MIARAFPRTVMRMDSLAERIRAAARALGFEPVGITSADPLEEDRARLLDWVAGGAHGSMAYMADRPERRADPRATFPEARSVMSLGMSYAPALAGSTEPDARGARVARYARGRDYHKLIWKRLSALEAAIAAASGRPFNGRTFVDTGPLLERAFARRAGLGFVGKNTMLIHPLHGSYLFLATVLTDLELAPDAPSRTSCGSCRLCLDACPTQALTPMQLDATRCLSYLTIEERGPIAPHLRDAVGGWAFGCDICQEVCPYNRHATPTREPDFAPERGAGAALDLAQVLALTAADAFLARFAGTPLTRPKREGLVRNACLAAAHTGRHDLVPQLAALLSDASALVRAHAAWALARLGGPPARAALAAALARESDAHVRAELESGIAAGTAA